MGGISLCFTTLQMGLGLKRGTHDTINTVCAGAATGSLAVFRYGKLFQFRFFVLKCPLGRRGLLWGTAFGAAAGLTIGLTEVLLRFAFPDSSTLPARSNQDVARDFARVIKANLDAKREVETELEELERKGDLHRVALKMGREEK